MKFPNFNLAIVPERKITHYLLNPAHPAGGSKAVFFLRFGFSLRHWETFARMLVQHGLENDCMEQEEMPYGTRYVVDGILTAPDGTRLNIRSVWFIDTGAMHPRFVTAHPLPKP